METKNQSPKNLPEIQQWLVEQKPTLIAQYHIKTLGLFGSYRRQEQTPDSDLDILVEFTEVPSLLKFINLENHLSDNLGIKVDLVHQAGLKPRIGERVLAEVLYL